VPQRLEPRSDVGTLGAVVVEGPISQSGVIK